MTNRLFQTNNKDGKSFLWSRPTCFEPWTGHQVKGKTSLGSYYLDYALMLKQWAKGPALFSLTQNWGEGLQLECLSVFVFSRCANQVKTKNLNFQTSPSPPRVPGVADCGAESFITHLLRFHLERLPFPSALMYSVCLGHCLFCRQSAFAHRGIMLSYLFFCIFNMWASAGSGFRHGML